MVTRHHETYGQSERVAGRGWDGGRGPRVGPSDSALRTNDGTVTAGTRAVVPAEFRRDARPQDTCSYPASATPYTQPAPDTRAYLINAACPRIDHSEGKVARCPRNVDCPFFFLYFSSSWLEARGRGDNVRGCGGKLGRKGGLRVSRSRRKPGRRENGGSSNYKLDCRGNAESSARVWCIGRGEGSRDLAAD